VAIDFETIGLNIQDDKIVSIGWTTVNPSEHSLVSKECYVNPHRSIPPEATAIHSITDDMVKDAPNLRDALNFLYEDLDFGTLIVGYNTHNFDWPILFNNLLDNPEYPHPPCKASIDIGALYRDNHPGVSWTLSKVYKRWMKEDFTNAHNAQADSEACIGLLAIAATKKYFPNLQEIPREFIIKPSPVTIQGHCIEHYKKYFKHLLVNPISHLYQGSSRTDVCPFRNNESLNHRPTSL
jgi:DNA polymerase III epsilon subunit-like protein